MSRTQKSRTIEYIGGATAPFQYGIAATARDTQMLASLLLAPILGFTTSPTARIWHGFLSRGLGGTWWNPLQFPSVVSWSSQWLDVFGIGEAPTYQLFQMTWDGNGWGDWIGHSGDSLSTHAPDVVSWSPGRFDVFTLGANDHALYYDITMGRNGNLRTHLPTWEVTVRRDRSPYPCSKAVSTSS